MFSSFLEYQRIDKVQYPVILTTKNSIPELKQFMQHDNKLTRTINQSGINERKVTSRKTVC
jgi:hypothetical protein